MHQYRIEFDLGNLRAALRGELRDLRNQLRQRRNVGFRRPLKPLSNGAAFSSPSIAVASAALTGAA